MDTPPDSPTEKNRVKFRKRTGEIVERDYDIPKGTARYVKHAQCAAVYRKGIRAGERCRRHAMKDALYCKRHNHGSAEWGSRMATSPARKAGEQRWWARVRALEQQHPGIVRRILNTDAGVAARHANKALEQTFLPRPANPDRLVQRAHKAALRQVRELAPVPDKPFAELTLSEQNTVNTRLAVKRVHDLLHISYEEKDGTVNPRLATIVREAAQRQIANATKIDRNAIAAQKVDRMADILARLKAGDDARTIEG